MKPHDDLIEAFRRHHTPDPATEQAMWARLERESGPVPRNIPWRAVAVVLALAAALAVVWVRGGPDFGRQTEAQDAASLAGYVVDSGATGTGGTVQAKPSPAPSTRRPVAPPETTTMQPEPAPSNTVPAPVPGPQPSATKRPTAAKRKATSEVELLGRAQALLRDGKATRSLAVLKRYRNRYRAGVLLEDAAALEVLALCGAKRVAQARRAADRFLERYRSSPHQARIRRSCAGDVE